MRGPLLLMALLVTFSAWAHSADATDQWNWDQWRRLPVQNRGRQKPLDTMARETLRAIAHRQSFVDPETDERLDSVALYLKMLFDWRSGPPSAELPLASRGAQAAAYFVIHQPDKWDRMRLLYVDHLALREALGMPTGKSGISAVELCRANMRVPELGRPVPFVQWVAQFESGRRQPVSAFEEHALRLAASLRLYQIHRMGLEFNVLPVTGSPQQEWMSISRLWNSEFDASADPTGVLQRANEGLKKVIAALADGSPGRFNESSAEFISSTIDGGPKLGVYPDPAWINLEVTYNQWKPLRCAWILTLSALLAMCMGLFVSGRVFYTFAMAAFGAGQIAILMGLGARVVISGRAPVTNMYESVIFACLGIGLLGLTLELRWRRSFAISAAAAVTTLLLVLADFCPVALNPAIEPLQPVLRSNFWLVVHVLTITLSYSAYAFALGVGNITLGYYIARSQNWDAIDALGNANARCLRIGTLLLAVGTVTGAIWADYSWGRFWGWDPKEVWALITLLGYLGVLHARHVRWVGSFGLAALSVICFSLVVIAWYGVNFVLGSGLHSYGSGDGGKGYVIACFFVQSLYVAIAAARSAGHTRAT